MAAETEVGESNLGWCLARVGDHLGVNLALWLGVPVWVAPLVAPAVDLSILGLLLGTRHLALAGASLELLRPVRRLLVFASVVTLALNGSTGVLCPREDFGDDHPEGSPIP